MAHKFNQPSNQEVGRVLKALEADVQNHRSYFDDISDYEMYVALPIDWCDIAFANEEMLEGLYDDGILDDDDYNEFDWVGLLARNKRYVKVVELQARCNWFETHTELPSGYNPTDED